MIALVLTCKNDASLLSFVLAITLLVEPRRNPDSDNVGNIQDYNIVWAITKKFYLVQLINCLATHRDAVFCPMMRLVTLLLAR
jgi:hypothetical protein